MQSYSTHATFYLTLIVTLLLASRAVKFTKGQICNGTISKIMSQGMESFLIVSQNAQLLHYATLLQYKPTKEHGNTDTLS